MRPTCLTRRPAAIAGVAFALAFGLAAGPDDVAAAHRASASLAVGERAPEALRHHRLTTLDGKTVTVAGLEGQVVVLNFWASWCAPCRRELPELDRLDSEIAKRGGRVLAVSIDADLDNARRFVRKHALAMPVCHDGPAGLAQTLDLDHVPFTIVIDRQGRIAFTGSGSDQAALASLGDATRRALADPAGAPAAAVQESR